MLRLYGKISLTVLAWVQAEWSSLQHSSVLADVPDVEVYKDRDGGEPSNSQPGQHEDVCQHDELQGKQHGLPLCHVTFVTFGRKFKYVFQFSTFCLTSITAACVAGYNKNTVGVGGSIWTAVTHLGPFGLRSTPSLPHLQYFSNESQFIRVFRHKISHR